MDSSLIDEVMRRTGADYETAKAALESCDGHLDIASRVIQSFRLKNEGEQAASDQDGSAERAEEKSQTRTGGQDSAQRPPLAKEILDAIKDIWKRGNASRLDVEKDGKVLLSLSLSISAIGVVIAPLAALIGLGAAIITDYLVTITLDNGTVVNVNEFAVSRRGAKDVTPEDASAED